MDQQYLMDELEYEREQNRLLTEALRKCAANGGDANMVAAIVEDVLEPKVWVTSESHPNGKSGAW